ncbi:iron ABC transporter substrate-binding protein [uncultured Aliiroseovarius sp.]|uniref:iron ABC transporter substrate-binding protein n=1 Tax=uncultured Aliiroseovarius sp. TaxID=1658783 RepID=UPI00259992C7|nr:iron ABC transporter substrate-binding protein [uncultured Aliiroseovarius sp.]
MRHLLFIFALLALPGLPADARSVTDSAGREVEIPDEVTTVFAAGPPAAVLVYVMKPETLVGWPRALRPEEREYIAKEYRGLPESGRLTGRGGEANLERVLQIQPDLIIDFGSVRDTYIDLANRVQEQTGIPYLLIDGRFENTAEALRITGEALGEPERGTALAKDVEARFARIDAVLADIPEADRPGVYLARGADGLETGMQGSINTEIIERAGGRNVADDGGTTRGLVQTSVEQVIVADPDAIVTWDANFYGKVFDAPLWQGVTAVREGQVYLSPMAPFGWIDRPPSLNRMVGLNWMAGLLHPDRWEGDLREDTRDFYKLYYHIDLTDDELERLLEWAEGRPPM